MLLMFCRSTHWFVPVISARMSHQMLFGAGLEIWQFSPIRVSQSSGVITGILKLPVAVSTEPGVLKRWRSHLLHLFRRPDEVDL